MKLRYIKLALTVFTTSWLLTSCLKDSAGIMDPAESNNVIEFANTGTPVKSPTATSSVSFTADLGSLNMGDSSSFNINISYSGADMAPNDITVNLEVVDSIMDNYNSTNNTGYILPPTSVIDYSSIFPKALVIKKGTQKVQFVVPAKLTTDYDYDADYAIPLKITSVSNGIISGNYGTALFIVSVRNTVDGAFTVTGTFKDIVNSAFVGAYPRTINLVTVGAKSVAYFDPNLNSGTYGYRFLASAGGSGTYFGNFDPIFNYDLDGKITSVSNYYGTASQNASGRDAIIDPSGVNQITFDSDGKPSKIEVSYIMVQAGTQRTFITENFTYKGARD